jgi:GTP-binding protein YchF
MGVACGIVGLPNVGKSTLFSAFTATPADRAIYPFSTTEANVAVVNVPDERLETIRKFIATERIVPAAMRVVDIPGLAPGASKGEGMGNKFLGSVKEADAILHVVRCFDNPQVVRDGPVDPKGDMELLELELAMADHETVARNLERVGKKARAGEKQAVFEKEVFEKAKAILAEGKLLRGVDWKPAEIAALRPLFLMTIKPMLYVANVDQEDLAGNSPGAQAVAAHAAETGSGSIHLCGDLECELVNMGPDDRGVFQKELGIEELALPRLIRKAFELLGLQTFFTAGPKEIRAWTIRKGDTGPVAAGVIHTDFEKGYIRAEVYSVDDLVQFQSEAAIKAHGKMRVEGREYVMHDSDVAHFLVATK